MDIQVPEGDRSTTSVLLRRRRRRQSRVRKDAFRRRENVVEKVILQVPSGQRLGLLVLYCECLSAGERRRASGRFRNKLREDVDDGGDVRVGLLRSGHVGWMEREGEWRSTRGKQWVSCIAPPANLRFWPRSLIIQNVHFPVFSRHSFLFSAIQSPFHFPKHGRHAWAGTAAEQATPDKPSHSTNPPFSVAGMFPIIPTVALFCNCLWFLNP